MEYLCARYVNPDDPVPGQQRIDRILSEHYVESSAKELIKSHIKENGDKGYVLLGQLQVRLDTTRDHYWAEVPALDDNFVRVSAQVLRDHGEALLSGGAWGTMTIEYDAAYQLGGRIYPSTSASFSLSRSHAWIWMITSPSAPCSRRTSGSACSFRASASTQNGSPSVKSC
jgi:predicted ATP-dependent Lon-type protease